MNPFRTDLFNRTMIDDPSVSAGAAVLHWFQQSPCQLPCLSLSTAAVDFRKWQPLIFLMRTPPKAPNRGPGAKYSYIIVIFWSLTPNQPFRIRLWCDTDIYNIFCICSCQSSLLSESLLRHTWHLARCSQRNITIGKILNRKSRSSSQLRAAGYNITCYISRF